MGERPGQPLLHEAMGCLRHGGQASTHGAGGGALLPCSLTEALLPFAERSTISWLVKVMNS